MPGSVFQAAECKCERYWKEQVIESVCVCVRACVGGGGTWWLYYRKPAEGFGEGRALAVAGGY